jgi:hypothetical protein
LKQLQEAVKVTLEQIDMRNNFLNRTQKAQHLRETMSKWDCIKLKSSAQQKKQSPDSRDDPQNGTKSLSATQLTGNSKNSAPSRINTPMKKWAHELNREFSKEEVHMASKYMKKCSTSLVIKEMQIKTTLRFHLTPVRMAIMKGNTTRNAGKDFAKQEPLYAASGNAN